MSAPEPPGELFEFGSDFYNEHQERINEMIGKLTVPALRDPLVREVHRDLIALSIWFDKNFEEEQSPSIDKYAECLEWAEKMAALLRDFEFVFTEIENEAPNLNARRVALLAEWGLDNEDRGNCDRCTAGDR